jgi:osmotically-inducible protein OsmY
MRTLHSRCHVPLHGLLLGVALLTAAAGGLHAAVAAAGEPSERPSTSNTAELRTELVLRLALLENLKSDGLRVHIDVDGDQVTLSGEVRHRSSRELAEEVAKSVKGVSTVRSDLVLEGNGAGELPVAGAVGQLEREVADAALEAKVKLRLLDTAGTPALEVEVEASEGVVSLRGTVPDREHRKIVLRTARDTDGVLRVIDLLRVA